MSEREATREYTNGDLTVIWDASKCTHSGHCVRELPQVFNLHQRPWVNMLGADSETIRRQVHACPSGALSLKES